MNESAPTDGPKNRGHFKRGHDPRRHRFTRDECQAGFQAALISIITRYPDAVNSSGLHMACAFLYVAGRLNNYKERRQADDTGRNTNR
jgi:hypothetical protein